MDFADILDEIARPAPAAPDAASSAQLDRTARFWDAFDQVRDSSSIDEKAAIKAYLSEDPRGDAVALDDIDIGDLSLDPNDIAFELDLASVASLQELSVLRRRFARLNHPDRMPPELRERANTRMTIANAMIDGVATQWLCDRDDQRR